VAYESRLRHPSVDRLFQAILSLRDVDECYRFFEDLCTIREVRAMAQRFEVARMLAQGYTYDAIVEATGMSTATISRIRRFLDYGADGYRLALERLGDIPRPEAPDARPEAPGDTAPARERRSGRASRPSSSRRTR